MQIFKNKFGQWIPIVLLLIGGLLAADRIRSTQPRLAKEITNKLDKEIYDRDQLHRQRELDRLQAQLDRIEEKLDNVLTRYHKDNPGGPGSSEPAY